MNRKVISRAICSLLGGATLFTAASFERDIKSQVPLVCSEVYRNAYMYNDIPFKTCSLNERKDENLLFEYDPLDVSLTKADAKYVRNMPFDAEYTNAKDLKIFKNLEEITIINYSLLSREELKIINSLPSLKEITIMFSNEEFDLYGLRGDFTGTAGSTGGDAAFFYGKIRQSIGRLRNRPGGPPGSGEGPEADCGRNRRPAAGNLLYFRRQ